MLDIEPTTAHVVVFRSLIDNGSVQNAFPTSFDGEAITCFQAVSCVMVGATGGTVYAASVNPVTGQPAARRVIPNMTAVSGTTCATASRCFAVGYLVANSTLTARVSDIDNGLPRSAVALSGQSLAAVACPTATTCWAVGEDHHGTGIVDPVPVP